MFKIIDSAMEAALVALLLVMVAVGGLQIFNRFVFNASLSWSEELQRFAHIWLVFLAVPVAYRRGAHIGMNILVEHFSPSVQSALKLSCELLWLAFGLCVAYYAWIIMDVAKNQTSPGLGITMSWIYLAQVVGGCYLAISVVRSLTQGAWKISGSAQ